MAAVREAMNLIGSFMSSFLFPDIKELRGIFIITYYNTAAGRKSVLVAASTTSGGSRLARSQPMRTLKSFHRPRAPRHFVAAFAS